jgi:hypothetical protein
MAGHAWGPHEFSLNDGELSIPRRRAPSFRIRLWDGWAAGSILNALPALPLGGFPTKKSVAE